MAQLNFNAAEIDTTSRDAIPSGTYEAVVTDSETRATKNGTAWASTSRSRSFRRVRQRDARCSRGSTTRTPARRRSRSGARSWRAFARRSELPSWRTPFSSTTSRSSSRSASTGTTRRRTSSRRTRRSPRSRRPPRSRLLPPHRGRPRFAGRAYQVKSAALYVEELCRKSWISLP